MRSSWRNRSPGDVSIELDEIRSTPVDPAVEAASLAFEKWGHTPADERFACLKTAQAKLTEKKDALARGIAIETGKPITEALGEVGAVIAKIDLTIDDAKKHLARIDVTDGPHPAWVARRPRGAAGVIGPFNFPLHLAHGGIVAHLAAGNTVVFKPSPLAAVVAREYGAIMASCFPDGVFNLVQGGGAEGEALCLHPKIRSVTFTGSAAVGRKLAAAIAPDLGKELALELGGKCAGIVCDDADLSLAAKACADAACLTSGQRCNATSRVIVDHKIAGDFLPLFLDAIRSYIPGDPLDPRTKLGPLISASAVERYRTLIGTQSGQWILPGEVLGKVDGRIGHYVKPAVLRWENVQSILQHPLHCDEAFAPIAGVYESSNDDDAVRLHNLTPYGLSVSIFTRSRERFQSFVDRLHVGNVYANLPTTFSPSTLPFGGLGASGNGRPSGRGFIRFVTDEQAIQVGKDTM